MPEAAPVEPSDPTYMVGPGPKVAGCVVMPKLWDASIVRQA
jgi:hypothetical protein